MYSPERTEFAIDYKTLGKKKKKKTKLQNNRFYPKRYIVLKYIVQRAIMTSRVLLPRRPESNTNPRYIIVFKKQ